MTAMTAMESLSKHCPWNSFWMPTLVGIQTNNSIRKQINKNRKGERKPVHQSGHHWHCYSMSNHWQRQMLYEGNKGDVFSIAFSISHTCRQKIRPRSSVSPLVTEKSHHQRLSHYSSQTACRTIHLFLFFPSLSGDWFFFFNSLTFPFLFPLKKTCVKMTVGKGLPKFGKLWEAVNSMTNQNGISRTALSGGNHLQSVVSSERKAHKCILNRTP